MRKLLVPFDGSDSAHRALAYAISLVRPPAGGTVHLVNVYEETPMYGDLAAYVPPDKLAEIQRTRGADVLAQARSALVAAGVTYTEDVIGSASAAEAIVRRADELGCQAIVMGTRGMTAVGNLLMGSVATRVVHAAKVPVTLVK